MRVFLNCARSVYDMRDSNFALVLNIIFFIRVPVTFASKLKVELQLAEIQISC